MLVGLILTSMGRASAWGLPGSLLNRSFNYLLSRAIRSGSGAFVAQKLAGIMSSSQGDGLASQMILYSLDRQVKDSFLPPHARGAAELLLNEVALMPTAQRLDEAREYINRLTAFPWARKAQGVLDLEALKRNLDLQISGFDEAKQSVVDLMALRMEGMSGGHVLCLVGPPAAGKTHFAREVSRALKLPMLTVCVAGMNDPDHFFKGFSRSYARSHPGWFVEKLSHPKVRVCNPVVIIDEIDKSPVDSQRGSVKTILLEAFDPEQNHEFSDHYLNVGIDLSSVFFIATANYEDQIPRELKSRMHIVRMGEYTIEQKCEIIKKHLWDQIMKDSKRLSEPVKKTLDFHKDKIVYAVCEAVIKGDVDIREARRLMKVHIARIIRTSRVSNRNNGSPKVGISKLRRRFFSDAV